MYWPGFCELIHETKSAESKNTTFFLRPRLLRRSSFFCSKAGIRDIHYSWNERYIHYDSPRLPVLFSNVISTKYKTYQTNLDFATNLNLDFLERSRKRELKKHTMRPWFALLICQLKWPATKEFITISHTPVPDKCLQVRSAMYHVPLLPCKRRRSHKLRQLLLASLKN